MQSIGVGFSFDGIHCDDMMCELANHDECMHAISDVFAVLTESVDGYKGEYYAGETVKGRDFNIDLLVENADDDVLLAIGGWLCNGKSGRLIFDHMPYKYYVAKVMSEPTRNLYVGYDSKRNMFTYSGIVSFKLKAFVPRAYMLEEVREAYPEVGDMLETLNAGSGIIEESQRPKNYGTSEILILNAGNAEAKSEIWISGMFPTGTVITNKTTGQSMTIRDDGSEEKMYCVDSLLGRTTAWTGAEHPTTEAIHKQNLESGNYIYADNVKSGNFITLKGCFPRWRKIRYIVNGSDTVITNNGNASMKGQYVYIQGAWYEIIDADATSLTLDRTVTEMASGTTTIAGLNHIVIEPGEGDSVGQVTVYHKDTFY